MKIKILLLFSLIFLFLSSCGTKEDDVIKIGAILPLTGDVAVYGNNTKEGIDLAVEEINSHGGIFAKKILIFYEDSKAEPKIGISALQSLISKNDIQVIIDNSVSSVALALVPIAEKNSVVIISTGSTNPKLSGISPFFFRIWNSDDLEGKFSARFLFDTLQLTTSSILYVNNDYGRGLEAVYQKEFNSLGGRILSSESFEQNEVNFRTVLTKIKNDNPQALYLVGYSKEIGNVLKQIKELNLKAQIIGTVTMQDPQVVKIAGNSSNNVIYPYPLEPNKNDSSVSHFYNAFRNKYKKKPGITADVGYDAVYLLIKAMKLSSGESGELIKNGLSKIKEYHGVSGIIEFDNNGDVNKPMIIKQIKNGEFIVLGSK